MEVYWGQLSSYEYSDFVYVVIIYATSLYTCYRLVYVLQELAIHTRANLHAAAS